MAAINKVVQNLNEHVTKMMSPPRVQRKNTTRKSLSDAFGGKQIVDQISSTKIQPKLFYKFGNKLLVCSLIVEIK